jgi:putative phosphoesterase
VILGLISDTHGLLRPAALLAMGGADLIIHAGDVGDPRILDQLEKLAPVVAVRGNIDTAIWAKRLPVTAVADAGGVKIYILHSIADLDLAPSAAGFSIVVSGHSHKPVQAQRDGVTYINPGSAGPRRFNLPITVARLDLNRRPWKADLIGVGDHGDSRSE